MILQSSQRLDEAQARRVMRAHPWAVLVTHGDTGLLASHMPALVDETAEELAILSHTARADPQTARIEAGEEVLIVFQGEHGFLPGEWEGGPGASVGTWDFEVVHASGRPQTLDRDASLDLLRRTFEHLEARRSPPTPWACVAELADELVGGVCCFRVPVTGLAAKAKLGQEKPVDVRERLIAGLERPGPYHQPRLAHLIRGTLPGEQG